MDRRIGGQPIVGAEGPRSLRARRAIRTFPVALLVILGTLVVIVASTSIGWGEVSTGHSSISPHEPDGNLTAARSFAALTRPDASEGWVEPTSIWRWGGAFAPAPGAVVFGDAILLRDGRPAIVGAVPRVIAVATGTGQDALLQADGTVWRLGLSVPCAGSEASGDYLGQPARVDGLPAIKALAAGACHVLAVAADGTVWAWGGNHDGQLGDGTRSDRTSPVQIAGLPAVREVAAGQKHSLAAGVDGTVWAWGSGIHGELGTGAVSSSPQPVRVLDLADVVMVGAGRWHSLALTNAGAVYGWGLQGVGPESTHNLPRVLPGLDGVTALAAGGRHALALRMDGTVWAWGANEFGQVDPATPATHVHPPFMVEGLANVRALAAGEHHSLALTDDGMVWTWGAPGAWDPDLDRGISSAETRVRRVDRLFGIVAIAAGETSSLAAGAPHALPTPGFR